MLKTKVISLILVVVLLIGVPVMASAALLDPYDYATNIAVDGSNDVVTVGLPSNMGWWRRFHDGSLSTTGAGPTFMYSTQMRYVDNDTVYYYPFGYGNSFPTDGIPRDTEISGNISFKFTATNFTQGYSVTHSLYLKTWDTSGNQVYSISLYSSNLTPSGSGSYTDNFTFTAPAYYLDDAASWSLEAVIDYAGVSDETDTTAVTLSYDTDLNLKYSISSLWKLQQETGKTNKLLEEVSDRLESNGQTLDDILKQQEANGDKLDDMNQSIETLPGAVGDEIQGIIDNEKDEANNQGNEFVDQILEALPDPSTKVLASLKSLTDATSYTGTDAKLQIPGIVLPAVGMLIPETEIWEGAELDFGAYMQLLPEILVTVVQSLFTIAIVLYCVYELIGLIGFCLTLRGGGS